MDVRQLGAQKVTPHLAIIAHSCGLMKGANV
jgi:hypothetical protein